MEQQKYDYDPSFAVRGLHCDVERVSEQTSVANETVTDLRNYCL